MVKQIVIDENANKTLKNILTSDIQQTNTGLLIGNIDGSTTDYILNITATSPQTDQNTKNESGFDFDWIINHAMQIHDMLIGGMDIVGIYCVDLTPTIGKQVLTKLFNRLNEFAYYKQMKFNQERLLFLVDTKTKNINMKSLDLNSTSSTFQQCELSTKSLLSQEFFKLNSNLNLKTLFKTPNVKSHNLLKEDFYKALSTEDMLTDENKYICLINNCMIEDTKTFSEFKANIPQEESSSSNEYNAVLMENLSSAKSNKLAESSSTNDSIYELTGVCNLVVLFHKSMNFKTIKRLLIYDLMRSLYARVRLLVDDLDARSEIIGDGQSDDPNSNDVEENYQTPNRIHVLMDSNYLVCDYVFPDENDSDICERIKELFNYDVTDPQNQLVFVEDLPPEIKRSQSDDDIVSDGSGLGRGEGTVSGEKRSSSKRGSITTSNDSFDRSSTLIIAFLVALIAFILAGYYSFRNEDSSSNSIWKHYLFGYLKFKF